MLCDPEFIETDELGATIFVVDFDTHVPHLPRSRVGNDHRMIASSTSCPYELSMAHSQRPCVFLLKTYVAFRSTIEEFFAETSVFASTNAVSPASRMTIPACRTSRVWSK